MLKIGSIGWGECDKCLFWEEEGGCQVLDNISITRDEETVYCVDGIEAEILDQAEADVKRGRA